MEIQINKTIQDVSDACGVECEMILRFIEESWINPFDKETLLFDNEDMARIKLIWDLSHELGVNDEAMPIILNLVDQVNRLHIEIHRLHNEPN